jgi:ribose transport system substrate-binding protein
MTRLRAILIVAAALAPLPSCNRQSRKRIAVIAKGRSHMFWQSVHAGSEKAARETGVEIIWNAPATETDFNGQLQMVDSAISQHVDSIVLAPIDKTAMAGVVDRAMKQQIPVIIFDSGVDTDNFVAQVATDNFAAGEAGAERIGTILNGAGKVAMVMVQPGSASSMLREEGFQKRIGQKFPKIEIVDRRYGMASFAESMKVAENMLTAHPSLDALFASNESSTVGAVRALKSRPGTKVKLVGFDSSPALVEDVKTGIIDSLVVQDPFRMGYDAVNSAVLKLQGGTPERIQNLPPLVVTTANLNDPKVQAQLNPPLDQYLN